MRPAPFGLHLDGSKLRQISGQRVEEGGVDQQLFFILQPLLNARLQRRQRKALLGLIELHRGVVSFEQRIVAHIAHVDHTARLEQAHGAGEYPQQIVNRGKILDNRIEDDTVKAPLW